MLCIIRPENHQYTMQFRYWSANIAATLPAKIRSRDLFALMAQLVRNLQALRVEKLETLVGWDEADLMSFLRASGFAPAPRLCLEMPLED